MLSTYTKNALHRAGYQIRHGNLDISNLDWFRIQRDLLNGDLAQREYFGEKRIEEVKLFLAEYAAEHRLHMDAATPEPAGIPCPHCGLLVKLVSAESPRQ